MPSCKKKATAAKLSPWRAALLRCSARYLDLVCAPDEKAALGAVIADFKISEKRAAVLGHPLERGLNLRARSLLTAVRRISTKSARIYKLYFKRAARPPDRHLAMRRTLTHLLPDEGMPWIGTNICAVLPR